MIKFSFFIGIDVSKAVIDVSYFQNDQVVYLEQYLNSEKGFKKFIKALSKISNLPMDQWFVCFENTGAYSKPLLYWLIEQGIPCREENPSQISKSLGIRRGKDDKHDSKDICYYAFEKRDRMEVTKLDHSFVIILKILLSRRDLMVKQRTALKASMKERKGSIEEELYKELEDQNNAMITYYDEQIKVLEHKIEQTINSNTKAAKNNKLLQSIVGISTITAAYMIATTNNFESFTNSRKYACYAGIAPFPNSSGTRKGKTRVHHMANKKIKSILSNGAIAALVHDPEISIYYQTKIGQGKESGVVINNIKNKLVHRAFAVIKRQTPFVKMMTYA